MSGKHIALLFAFAVVLFSSSYVLRFASGNPYIVGIPSYYHTRIAGDIASGSFSFYDNLSFEGRNYTYPPLFPSLIAAVSIFSSVSVATVIIASLTGAFSVLLVYMISSRFLSERLSLFAAFAFALLPGSVIMFSEASSRTFPLMLSLFSLYLLIRYAKSGESRLLFLSAAVLGLSSFFHPEPAFVFLGGAALLFFSEKMWKKFALFVSVFAIIFASFYVPFFLVNGPPVFNGLHADYIIRGYSLQPSAPKDYFHEFGSFPADGYLTVFAALLALAGLFYSPRFVKLFSLYVLVLSLAVQRFLIYLPFAAALLIAFFFAGIMKPSRGQFSSLFLAAFVVYSSVFAAVSIRDQSILPPDSPRLEALLWIRDNTPQGSVILSDWSLGHWITGIAVRPSFIDGYAEYAPSASLRLEELHAFYANCTVPPSADYFYSEKWLESAMISCNLSSFGKVYENDVSVVYSLPKGFSVP